MTWYVIGVRSGLERRIRDELHARELPALVPVRFIFRRSRAGRYHVPTALLPGYLFARLADADWQALCGIEGWRGPVRIGDRLMTLTATELEAVALMSRPAPVHVDTRYRVGDKVSITLSHTTTLNGLVARVRRGQVVVAVEMLGKLHEIAVAEDQLEAA